MIAKVLPTQQKYCEVSSESGLPFTELKKFFKLRGDSVSCFTPDELMNGYADSRSGFSYAPRAGDIIVLIHSVPASKPVIRCLRARRAVGLNALMNFVPGAVIDPIPLDGDYDRVFFVLNPDKDRKLMSRLASYGSVIGRVGTVTRSGVAFIAGEEEPEQVFAEENIPAAAVIEGSDGFINGYCDACRAAFEGGQVSYSGDLGYAVGVFSARNYMRCELPVSYTGAAPGDRLYAVNIPLLGGFPAPAYLKKLYKNYFPFMRNGTVRGCGVSFCGDMTEAAARAAGRNSFSLSAGLAQNGGFTAVFASRTPLRGRYIGVVTEYNPE